MENLGIKENILRIQKYIPGKPIKLVQKELGLKDVIKLASNENPLGPSPKAIRAVRQVVNDLHRYPESGCPELRETVAKKIGLKDENIVVGNGSNEIIELIAEAFISPGDEVIISEQTFIVYPIVIRLMDGVEVTVKLKNYTYDLPSMLEKITSKTKMVFVCNPNNPTGTIVDSAQVEEFLSNLPKHIVVVFDEAYYEYVTSSSYPQTIQYIKERPLIVLRTFSKIYGLAGVRVGYGIANPEIIALLDRIRQPFNVNSLAIVAALAAIKDHKHIEESIKLNNEGKQFLYRAFNEIGLEYVPTEANFIFVNLKKDVAPVIDNLLKTGIIIRPMGGTFARITIGTSSENEQLVNSLKRLLQ